MRLFDSTVNFCLDIQCLDVFSIVTSDMGFNIVIKHLIFTNVLSLTLSTHSFIQLGRCENLLFFF